MAGKTQLKFMDIDLLRSLGNIELQARFLVEGMYASRHRCPFYGFSVEFKDYREYVPGDEPRMIDWKAWGRTEKYYVRRFEMESEMDVVCILDVSGSMGYQGRTQKRLSKLEYASYLTAGMLYLVNKQQDAGGLITFDSDIRDYMPPRQGKRHLYSLLAKLENLEARNETDLGALLHSAAVRLRRRGLVILISDCHGDEETVASGIRHLGARGHDLVMMHLLDHDEVEFPFDALTAFRDMESGQELMCDPLSQRRRYLQRRDSFCDTIRQAATSAGADYRFVDTSEPIELVLRDYLLYRRMEAS